MRPGRVLELRENKKRTIVSHSYVLFVKTHVEHQVKYALVGPWVFDFWSVAAVSLLNNGCFNVLPVGIEGGTTCRAPAEREVQEYSML